MSKCLGLGNDVKDIVKNIRWVWYSVGIGYVMGSVVVSGDNGFWGGGFIL